MVANCSKVNYLILTAMLVLWIAGCVSTTSSGTYYPDIYAPTRMTPNEASKILSNALLDLPDNAGGHGLRLLDKHYIQKIDIDKDVIIDEIKEINVVGGRSLEIVGNNGKKVLFPLESTYASTRISSDSAMVALNYNTLAYLKPESAKQFVDAIFVLKKVALEEQPKLIAEEKRQKQAALELKMKQDEAIFEKTVQDYRNAATKPVLSEDARKFKIQAEDAVRDKSFAEAADLYEKALDRAAWWPEGHFNRALVLSEVGQFETAIFEMKRYLRLAPDAPNSRAAQDKIYSWERKVKK